MSEDEYYEAQDEYGEDAFTAGIGAEAVREIMMKMDLEGERRQHNLVGEKTRVEQMNRKEEGKKETPARTSQSIIDFGPGRRSASTKNGHGKMRTQTTRRWVPTPSHFLRSHQSRVPMVDSRAPPSHSMHLNFTSLYCRVLRLKLQA